jgi:hypothetical protein
VDPFGRGCPLRQEGDQPEVLQIALACLDTQGCLGPLEGALGMAGLVRLPPDLLRREEVVGPERLPASPRWARAARSPIGTAVSLPPAKLQLFARQLAEGDTQDALPELRQWLPLSAAGNEAAAGVHDGRLFLDQSTQDTLADTVPERHVLTQEGLPVQPPFPIEAEHLEDETHDSLGSSLVHLDDDLDHAHALTGEALQTIAVRIIDHPRELRAREPVEGIVLSKDERTGRVGHATLPFAKQNPLTLPPGQWSPWPAT